MPDIAVSFKSDQGAVKGHEKGIERLMKRCPWLRRERWSVGELAVFALGNKYEFPRYAEDGNGRSMILSGDLRLDDIEERAGDRKGFEHFTEDSLFNSLFNLWQRKGKESLCGLNGRYSLVVWEENKKELNVATDPFGNRHIYYLHSNGHIGLSTNLSILTHSPYFDSNLDQQGVIESLRLGYQLEDRTLFSGIKLVPASSLMVFENGKIRFIENKRFTGFDAAVDISWKDATEELYFLLLESIKKRARVDDDYIIPLSGGLDSRCVAGLSDELGLKRRFYTYGVKGCKDLQIAPRIAAAVGASTEIALNKPDYILKRWGDPFLMNGDLRVPSIGVFVDFLEYIGANRGIFISGFMGETVTGSVYQFVNRDGVYHPTDNFFSIDDLASILAIPGWQGMVKEIPITLTKIREGFAGSDYTKDLMMDIVTRQRRFFSFQERLIEFYGGLVVPFEDVKVLEFILKLPFMALEKQELYKRFQIRYFPALAKIPSVAYGTLLPTAKSVMVSSLMNDFRYLNGKYFRDTLKIPSFLNRMRPVYPVDHGQAIRHNGDELNKMILEDHDALSEIFNLGKIQELMDLHLRGNGDNTWKILAVLQVLSGLHVCRDADTHSSGVTYSSA